MSETPPTGASCLFKKKNLLSLEGEDKGEGEDSFSSPPPWPGQAPYQVWSALTMSMQHRHGRCTPY